LGTKLLWLAQAWISAVHREVLLAQQLALVGQAHDLGEEALDYRVFEQPVAW
jgi:hypothetical protein